MSSPEKDSENGSNRHPGIIASLLRLPGDFRDLVIELRRLNNNLESLPGTLDEVAKLTAVLADLRTMTAPVLGWKVKED